MKKHFSSILLIFILLAYNSLADSQTMFAKFREFREQNKFTDFVIKSSDGQDFLCHKAVLAAVSDIWETMLSLGMKESQNSIAELPYSALAINIMLDFIYNPEKIIISDQELSLDLYYEVSEIAKGYFLDNLISALKKTKINIEEDQITYAIQIAIIFEDKKLIRQAFNIIKDQDNLDEDLRGYIRENFFNNVSLPTEQLYLLRNSSFVKSIFSESEREQFKFSSMMAVVEHVLDMANWSKEDLEDATEDKNYFELEQALINNLEYNIISQSSVLETPAQFASYFLSYYMVYMSAAWNAASNVAHNNAVAWKAAKNAAYSAASNVAHNAVALKAASNAAYSAAWVAASAAVKAALAKLEITDGKVIGQTIWRLANLYGLAYISHPEFNDYFMNGYNAALDKLENDPKFNHSTQEIYDIIGNHTWNKSEKLTTNAYIISLKNILDHVRPQG